MNTLNLHRSTFFCALCCLLLSIGFSTKSYAQLEYTTITKNINIDAKDLYHELSTEGDSLYLGYNSIFYRVTFLNSMDKRVMNFNPPVLEAKISLQDIIVGDYTVLVYTKDKIIVFHIARILEIEPQEAVFANVDFKNIGINSPTIDSTVDVKLNSIKMASIDNSENSGSNNPLADPMPYNISNLNREGVETRDSYRRRNLRPNGKPYN